MKNLRKTRERLGLTREDLASKLKVSSQTIYRWEEQGVEPHPIFQERIRRIFGALTDKEKNAQ